MNWAVKIVSDARKGILPIALLSGMINMLLLTSPLYMLQVYDRVLMSGQVATLIWVSMIALIAFIGLGLFDALRSRTLVQLGTWVGQRAAVDVMNASLQDATRNGDKSGRHLRDLQQIQAFIGGNSIAPFFDAPFAPFFVLMTFALHPYIGILTVFAGLIIFMIALWTDRRARKVAEDVREADLEAMKVAETFLLGSDYIESAGMRSLAISRYVNASKVYQDRHSSVQSTLANSTGFSKGLRMIFQSASLGIGALLVLRGEMTAGGMIAGSILMARALAPIDQSMNAWRGFQAARAAYLSLQKLASETQPDTNRLKLPKVRGEVGVERLAFLHPGQRNFLFADVSFKVEPGCMLCIVGASGTGKTTLCRVLTGVDKPSRGRVSIDDADLSQWDRQQFGENVGYLPQLPVFFDGTIAQNIARFDVSVSDEDIVQAAQSVGAHQLILQLPNGYATLVGPKGNRLSGGQTQLIGLARANFQQPRIIILDEPTAHLDDSGRQLFSAFLKLSRQNKQSVVIATHDPALVRQADRVVFLAEQTAIVKDRKSGLRGDDEAGPMNLSSALSVVPSSKGTSGSG